MRAGVYVVGLPCGACHMLSNSIGSRSFLQNITQTPCGHGTSLRRRPSSCRVRCTQASFFAYCRHDICLVLLCTSLVWQRGRNAIQVLASSLSLTSSGGLSISSAQLPPTLPADVNHGITHAVPALRRIFRNGGARSVASANVQQAAAVSPPVQPALSRRVASAAQHVMQPAIGAARLLVQAADAGWHQLLQGLTARRGAFATAFAIALGGAALLLLALKLWRRLQKVGFG